jgi:PAS domain S-box-containing protein
VTARAAKTSTFLRYAALFGAVTAAYYGTAKLGLALAFAHSSVTAVWAPTGIALAAILLWGYRLWPAVALGAFLANLGTGVPLLVVFGITTGNTLGALLGAWLLSLVGFRRTLDRVRDVLSLIVLAAMVSTTVSATIGVSSLYAGEILPARELSSTWLVWWLGDSGGDLLVGPVLLLLFTGGLPAMRRARRVGECVLLAALLVATSFLAFSFTRPIGYLTFPLLVLGAVRFRQCGAALGSLAVAGIAVWFTSRGTGPFVDASPDTSLIYAQTFACSIAITALVLAAITTEREQATEALAALGEELEAKVHERTADLEASEGELAQAQAVAHIGSWKWDVATDEISWSDELFRICGLEPGSVKISYRFYRTELVHPEDRVLVEEAFARCYETGAPFAVHHRIVRPDGGLRWIHGRGEAVMGDSRPIALHGTAQDITELLEARQELEVYARKLEQSNRELEDFASVASHDLQEPLRKIQAFGGRLSARFADALGSDGREYLTRMESAAARLQTLIEGLLTVSRVTTEAEPFDAVELGEIAREVVSDLETQLEDTGGRVVVRELPIVEADRLQMRQLLQNLIGNALKFHKPDEPPMVTVYEQRSENGSASIAVSDNGVGFEGRYADRIFTAFERLHGRAEYDGTGIGLALCRKIVQRHGGTIEARSVPGVGSTFAFTLPRGSARRAA